MSSPRAFDLLRGFAELLDVSLLARPLGCGEGSTRIPFGGVGHYVLDRAVAASCPTGIVCGRLTPAAA